MATRAPPTRWQPQHGSVFPLQNPPQIGPTQTQPVSRRKSPYSGSVCAPHPHGEPENRNPAMDGRGRAPND
jgi:hypothetical protein